MTFSIKGSGKYAHLLSKIQRQPTVDRKDEILREVQQAFSLETLAELNVPQVVEALTHLLQDQDFESVAERITFGELLGETSAKKSSGRATKEEAKRVFDSIWEALEEFKSDYVDGTTLRNRVEEIHGGSIPQGLWSSQFQKAKIATDESGKERILKKGDNPKNKTYKLRKS